MFLSSSVVSLAFSALSVHSEFGRHPHPLGSVPDFVSFAATITALAHVGLMVKNRVLSHSINHSSSLCDAPGTEALASEYHVSFGRYRPLKSPLRCEVVGKRWFWGPRFVGGGFGHRFSNRNRFRARVRFCLSSVRRAQRKEQSKSAAPTTMPGNLTTCQ